MPTPEFILRLREKIGTDPLWLLGTTALVLRAGTDSATPEILLVKRSDNGAWTPITGIVDPGEDPATTAVREAEEEAGLAIVVEKLLWVQPTRTVVYSNGDQAQYLDHAFLAHPADGRGDHARVNDEESSQVQWFPVDERPEMSERFENLLAVALNPQPGVLMGTDPTRV